MPAPAKPKKTARNKLGAFDEMIVTLPAPVRMSPRAQPAAAPSSASRPTFSDATLKRLIWAMWIGAMIIGGIGLGRLISAQGQPVSYEAPVPVATATVAVTAIPTANILFAQVTSVDQLTVKTATDTNQAQAGISLKTMSVGAIQGADVSDALQPGFNHTGRIQGAVGTNPVK